jgi:hypothetical protein
VRNKTECPASTGLHPQRDGQARFPDAGRPDQDDVLGAVDEAQAGQFPELLTVDRGLQVEIELIKGSSPRGTGPASGEPPRVPRRLGYASMASSAEAAWRL